VEITKDDVSSADQLREAFRDVAGDKGYVTTQDLKFANLPPDTVRFLSDAMPAIESEQSEEDKASGKSNVIGYDCKWKWKKRAESSSAIVNTADHAFLEQAFAWQRMEA
jgi:hypothetical protein